MTDKQRFYIELLRFILPYLRDWETRSLWDRLRFGSTYAEAELVHNLPRCLEEPEFGQEDLWWLNNQARVYLKPGAKNRLEQPVKALIKQIFQIVPPNLREELQWSEPL